MKAVTARPIPCPVVPGERVPRAGGRLTVPPSSGSTVASTTPLIRCAPYWPKCEPCQMACQRACCCSRIHLRSWSMSLSAPEHGVWSVSVRSSPHTGGMTGHRVGGVRCCFKADLMHRPALPGFAIGYRRISPGWATVWARWLSQPGRIHSCVLRRPPASDQAAMSPVTFPCSVSKVPSALFP